MFFILLFFTNCKSTSTRSDYHYKNCINNKTERKIYEGYGIEKDIFKLLKEAELSLINNKLLSNTNNEGYLKFISLNTCSGENLSKLKLIIKTNVNNNFFDLIPLLSFDFFSECLEDVYGEVNNTNEKTILNKRFSIYSALTNEGFDDKEKIIELINDSEDISKLETQRLTILYIILMNLNNCNNSQ